MDVIVAYQEAHRMDIGGGLGDIDQFLRYISVTS